MSALLEQRPEAGSFRFVLRNETRAEHQSLDANPAFGALLDGTLGLDGYRRLMLAFHGLYSQIDGPLRDGCDLHGAARSGFVYQPRSPMLGQDLGGLGVSPAVSRRIPSDEIGALTGSNGSLVGTLYVVEGSLLGGATLYKSTELLLENFGASGNSYWQWCREAGGRRWAMTCDLIDDTAKTEAGKREMIAAAQLAFGLFNRCLSPLAGFKRLEDVTC